MSPVIGVLFGIIIAASSFLVKRFTKNTRLVELFFNVGLFIACFNVCFPCFNFVVGALLFVLVFFLSTIALISGMKESPVCRPLLNISIVCWVVFLLCILKPVFYWIF